MTSTASSSGAKISMFGAKSGFVIPKNKLSGSLIPIFQRRSTLGGADADNGVPAKLGKRKTKWGPDLTQDTAVKKGKVLAYQKRLNQITQQLESGTLEAETNRVSALASLNAYERSLAYQNNNDIAQHLEFEKREAIGEIIGLNPRYKPPPDYRPLLKEARLPINVKEHSDFSSLSLLFGSQGDTQKRLEKETGAKVQIFGIKIGGEKVELCPADENEIQTAWQELYFLISSDTCEKVDAAIAVVELLISSVSGNTGAGAAPPFSRSGDISTIPANSNETTADPVFEQPTDSSVQPPQSQSQQDDSSFPLASNQGPFYAPLPSAPSLGNRIQDQELATNSVNPNPPFPQQPLSVPYNTSSLPPGSQVSRPRDLFSFSLSSTSMSYSTVTPQGLLTQPGFSTESPFFDSRIEPMGPRSTMRSRALLTFQHATGNVSRPTRLPDVVSSNMALSGWPLAPNFSPHPVTHQPGGEPPSVSFPSSINVKHLVEYASGGSLRPMSVSGYITGRLDGPVPTYPSINPPTNTAPRPHLGDFGLLPQQISSRPNSQSAHLPHPTFQAPPPSQHFGQSFASSQQFGRQMDLPLNHLPTPFHGNTRSSDLQNFGPPLPQMIPRNFPGAQFPQHSVSFPPRPVFRRDNLMPSGRPQMQHQFNTSVYDPFSPSDT